MRSALHATKDVSTSKGLTSATDATSGCNLSVEADPVKVDEDEAEIEEDMIPPPPRSLDIIEKPRLRAPSK